MGRQYHMHHTSFSSTLIVDNNKSHVSNSLLATGGVAKHLTVDENHQLIQLDVTCDQSSDFFNSSRVAVLTTSDKNKRRRDWRGERKILLFRIDKWIN
jgi:hypothetical protein